MTHSLGLVEFLARAVEGYLCHDLASMSELKPKSPRGGAAGYPMVSAVCSGMELLGHLLRESPGPFSKRSEGRLSFLAYWDGCLAKVDKSYRSDHMASAVYGALRNPLAHTFLAAPAIEVGKGDTYPHLELSKSSALQINATRLADHFQESYRRYCRPQLLAHPTKAQANLDALAKQLRDGSNQLEKAIESLRVKQSRGMVTKVTFMQGDSTSASPLNVGTVSPFSRRISSE